MRSLVCLIVLLTSLTAYGVEKYGRYDFDLREHHSPVAAIAFHPDGEHMASIAAEDVVLVWNLEKARVVHRLNPLKLTVTRRTNMTLARQRRIESIAYSPDGKFLAEAAIEGVNTGVVRLWSASDGTVARTLVEDARNTRALVFSADGKLLATSMRDGVRADHKIALYRIPEGDPVRELRGDRIAATHLAFTPDGKTLVSAGATRIHIWDVSSGELRHTISSHKKAIQALAMAPDGEHFATADADKKIRIWKTSDGTLETSLRHKQDGVYALAYSPSGRTLASGGQDHTIVLWNPKTGRRRDRLWHHREAVTALAFATDRPYLAAGSRDTTISLWKIDEPDDDDQPAEKEDEDEEEED